MTALFLDADACPVRAEALRVAERHQVRMFVVSNGGIRPSAHPLAETVIVDDGPDAADKWIAAHAGAGDIVVTADIPLAAKCLEGGARVVRHDGETFTRANIGNLLATRDLMNDLRASNPFLQGKGRAFSKADRSKFLDTLETQMRAAKQDETRR